MYKNEDCVKFVDFGVLIVSVYVKHYEVASSKAL